MKGDATMKKIITTSAVLTLLLTSLHADFEFGDVFAGLKVDTKKFTLIAPNADFLFGDVFKDLKVDTKVTTVKAPNTDFVFGDVFKDMK